MGSNTKMDPTPEPGGPALVRSTVGLLVLSLGGTASLGCKNLTNPPMIDSPPMAEEIPQEELPVESEPVEGESADGEPAEVPEGDDPPMPPPDESPEESVAPD